MDTQKPQQDKVSQQACSGAAVPCRQWMYLQCAVAQQDHHCCSKRGVTRAFFGITYPSWCCKERDSKCAGLQVIVITGDNKLTAEAICRKVGVFAVDEDLMGKSITGVEFMKLPLDKRRSMLAGNGGACFSRAEPKHKQVLLLTRIEARIAKGWGMSQLHCPLSI